MTKREERKVPSSMPPYLHMYTGSAMLCTDHAIESLRQMVKPGKHNPLKKVTVSHLALLDVKVCVQVGMQFIQIKATLFVCFSQFKCIFQFTDVPF